MVMTRRNLFIAAGVGQAASWALSAFTLLVMLLR